MRRHHTVFDTRTGKLEERPCDQSDALDPMQLLRDCPECSAALARGEQPRIRTHDEVMADAAAYRRTMAARGIDLDAVLDPGAEVLYDPSTGDEITIRVAPLGPDGQPDLSKLGPDTECITSEELARRKAAEGWTASPPPPRRSLFGRRPRWRDLKRGR